MKALPLIGIIILGIVIGYVWYIQDMPRTTERDVITAENSQPDPLGDWKTYTSAKRGISFKYPESYVVEEKEVGNGERGHYVITLMDKKAAANIPANSEGPTAITFDLFQNVEDLSAENWIKNNSSSNYKLSPDGTLTSVTLGGLDGFYYMWDGLYQGFSVVVPHWDDMVMLSATFNSPDDQIFQDFSYLISSVSFK